MDWSLLVRMNFVVKGVGSADRVREERVSGRGGAGVARILSGWGHHREVIVGDERCISRNVALEMFLLCGQAGSW